jgi:hypothetical protein
MPWLSQLLSESGFPLLVLSLAVSQTRLISDKDPKLAHHAPQPAELRLNDRLPKTGGKYGSSHATKSSEWHEEPLQH